jgi:serine/threonine-protein kinase
MQDPATTDKAPSSLKKLAPPKPDGGPAKVAEEEAPLPRKFGRLTLLKPIARGGMGEVFLATSGGIEGAERPCVVKIIRREYAEDPSFLARFFDEARIQAQLDHPGVAKVLEASTDPSGKPFVVAEYVEGRNLAEVRNRGSQLNANVGWPDALALGVALAEALTHVHERTDAAGEPLDIVHRDLSPQNVMIGYGGDVKLIDFGTARGENRKCHTVSGVVLAKPGYVAPEVANNQPGGVPSDLYALGVILWELCAGRRFLSGDATAHVAAVAAGRRNLPPIAELVKAPLALDTILARLTAPRIEDRYASAREVATDLVKILAKAPSLANGERGVRPRIAHLMERLYPAEPARSRADLARLTASARNAEPRPEASIPPAPSPLPAAVDDSLFPGTRYRLLREIGRGAMGVVYEAHHVDLGRSVALKVLPKESCQSPDLETRFRREARAIARLRHPNLVGLHDFGVSADGRPFYAMELLEGETLERYLERERGMDWREATRICTETLAALETAHSAGLVHRDIKPGNLFITRDGKLKLLDFGVVQMEKETEGAKDAEAIALVGTVEYMAPEQAAGEAVDERADLYAVGAVLYELVTGRRPHVAETTVALIDRKLRCEPESPRERAPGRGIPASLDRVIMRSLARFSAHRYKSATEMRMALEGALSTPERQRTARRRVATMALLACGMILGGAVVKNAARPEVRARAFAIIGPAIVRMGMSPTTPRKAQLAQKGEDEPVAVLYDAPKPAEPAITTGEPNDDSDEVAEPGSSGAPSTTDTKAKATPAETSPADSAEFAAELAKAERYTSKEKFVQALNVYREIAKRNPEDARVLHGWAEAAIKTKGWGEALRVAIKWASLDSSPEAQVYLAHVQQSAGQRYGAVATLTRLLDDHPENREAREMLSRISDSKLAAR